ncbi:unnamed protein product [Rhodiola kirilowii]
MMDMMSNLQLPRSEKQPLINNTDPILPIAKHPLITNTDPILPTPPATLAPTLQHPGLPPYTLPPPPYHIPHPPNLIQPTSYFHPSSPGDHYHQHTPRPPKLEIPFFTGDGVDGWLFQIKRYFEHHGVPPDQKLTLATFYLTGPALSWFHWMHLTHQVSV